MSNRKEFGANFPVTPTDDSEVPLVIDVDGTLTTSNLLIESFFRLASTDLAAALVAISALRRGKAALKAEIAGRAALDMALLPLNEIVVAMIRAERAQGRRIYLASAADCRYVQALADHLGLFDGVFASDGTTNLSGTNKAQALIRAFGAHCFDYAGNGAIDLPVWEAARRAILVGVPAGVAAKARQRGLDMREIPARRIGPATYARALRVHQWLKNLLVFVPALANHSLMSVWPQTLLAFAAFCLCASSVYLLNDLLDLTNDRRHPTKRTRPFAEGSLPLWNGLALIPTLLLGAGALAAFLPGQFAILLGLYYGTTLLYSLVLKRRIVIDVLTLAGLYTSRVMAGAAAAGIAVSEWLLAFSIFLFLCLALIKRYSELVERQRQKAARAAGRGYMTDDLPMVGALAGASGFVSILVLALYINSPEVDLLYNHPQMLWAVCLLLLYWVTRVLMLAHRGQIQDDPMVFAAKDGVSLAIVALSGLAVLAGSLP